MIDRPVLIPTSEGPLGGIISDPGSRPRAGMVLLGGYGRPARSGTNAFWTRTARSLARQGIAVLRVDYSREGESHLLGKDGKGLSWKVGFDLELLHQATVWFSERLGRPPLLLGGVCGGARLSIELAAREPEAIAGTFLVVPELSALSRPYGAGGSPPDDSEAVDPWALDCLRAILANAPSWALVGEHDFGDLAELPSLLGPTANPFEVELVPDVALHFLDQPDIQDQTRRRLIARVAQALAAREVAATGQGTPMAW